MRLKKTRLMHELEVKLEEKSTYMLAIIIVAISVLGFLAFLLKINVFHLSKYGCIYTQKHVYIKTCQNCYVEIGHGNHLVLISPCMHRDWPCMCLKRKLD